MNQICEDDLTHVASATQIGDDGMKSSALEYTPSRDR